MKVILKQDHDKLGNTGDVVNVKDGYAMNYLFPNRIAMIANNGNMKVLEHLKKQREARFLKEKAASEKIAAEISGVTIEIKMQAGEEGDRIFGSVTAVMIAEELTKKGYTIDKKQVALEESIKHLGEHKVDIALFKDVKGNVTATVTVNVVKEEQ